MDRLDFRTSTEWKWRGSVMGLVEDAGGFVGFSVYAMVTIAVGATLYKALDSFGTSVIGGVRGRLNV